ncbi:MAG: metalloregulator ArsR/SmtB family transcription factor [Halioglobus sp.]|nr:metalloregulator ArsR/SmtB family transcription factor [Halioglobus sp.]
MLSPNAARITGEAASEATPDQPFHALTGLCKATADSLRLLILRVLRNDSYGVSELCSIFDMRQPALSHHLKVLANAGLIAARREGNSIFYRRAELGQRPDLEALQNCLFDTVDQIGLPADIQQRLRKLHQLRETNSRNFFRDNAHKFQQQQDLIASYEQYADVVAKVLRDAPLRQRDTVLEVGPGDGSFLLELAALFQRVVALDNAPSMLEQARARVEKAGLENVDFIGGDTRSKRLAGLQADCVVINMVLHHTPAPGDVLGDVARCLAPGGVVLVTDLCHHDQGWARENCGDLWLGFDPQDLGAWAEQAGLHDIAAVYLAQRNGFQIQVRLFGRN